MVVVELAPEYGLVISVAALIGFQVIAESIPIGALRRKFFSKEFFAKEFPSLKVPPQGGYPDMGNGRYSAKLTDEQWLKFNYAQRAHQNYVEGAASIITFVLLSGLFYPRVSAALGLVNVVGRLVYGILYRKYGPSGRLLGAGLVDLALLGLFGTALYGGFQLAGGVNGWIAFGKSFLSLLPL